MASGENPQWLYTVVFAGHELWGPDGDPTTRVSVDAWEPYLEPAEKKMIDRAAAARATQEVPSIPHDADGPVFREPWEAQAFALAVALHERGLFSWQEWADDAQRRDQARASCRRSRHRRDLLPALARGARAAGGGERRHARPRRCIALSTPGSTPASARRMGSRSS